MLDWAVSNWQWLVIPSYLLCCLLAYGLLKRSVELMFSHYSVAYEKRDEAFNLFISLFGPCSLAAALILCVCFERKNFPPKLRFRMPKELKG